VDASRLPILWTSQAGQVGPFSHHVGEVLDGTMCDCNEAPTAIWSGEGVTKTAPNIMPSRLLASARRLGSRAETLLEAIFAGGPLFKPNPPIYPSTMRFQL